MGTKQTSALNWIALIMLVLVAVAISGNYLSFAPVATSSPSNMPPTVAPPSFNYVNLKTQAPSHSILNLLAIGGSVNTSPSYTIAYVGHAITNTVTLNIPSNLRTTSWSAGMTKMVNTQCGAYVWQNSTHSYLYESPINNGTGAAFSNTIIYTPTATGVYIFGAACVTTNTTFSNGVWSAWSTPNVTLSTYTAFKVPQLFNVTTTSTGCSGTSGSGTYFAGNTTSITAVPLSGGNYSVTWTGTGAGSYSGRNNPASISVTSNITEAATCTLIIPPPPPPPPSNIFSEISSAISGFINSILTALGL